MTSLILALALASSAKGQSNLRNTVTLGGGYARNIHSSCCQTGPAASLGVTYGYRLSRHFQIEAGITTVLHPTAELRGATFDIKPTDRLIWVPFGMRGLLPLRRDRIELSVAAGGLYEYYSASSIPHFVGLVSHDGWGGYFASGAAIAIGRGRHFWLGASPRWFLARGNHGSALDQWFVLTGDFSFRF